MSEDIISTEVRVQSVDRKVKHSLLGLLDTGATAVFIEQHALEGIRLKKST
jgi:hypothetical protein